MIVYVKPDGKSETIQFDIVRAIANTQPEKVCHSEDLMHLSLDVEWDTRLGVKFLPGCYFPNETTVVIISEVYSGKGGEKFQRMTGKFRNNANLSSFICKLRAGHVFPLDCIVRSTNPLKMLRHWTRVKWAKLIHRICGL